MNPCIFLAHRETTVGQVNGHSLKDKWDIFKEVQKFGFQFVIVGKLFEDDRVDDDFMKELVSSGEDLQNCFAFIEAFDGSLSYSLESPSVGKFHSN